MIITCPNCTTRYTVLPALIGEGRSTRCFNCGHTWHQTPVVSPPPPPMQAPPPPAMPAMAPQMAQQMMPQVPMPGQMAAPMADPMAQQMAGAVQPAPAAPMPEPAPPEPEPIPEPEPEPEPDPEPMDDFDLDDEFDIEDDDDGVGFDEDGNDEEAPALPADLDDMFGENEDMEPVESIMGEVDDEDDPFDEDMDPEDIPDPDPIPQGVTQHAGEDDGQPRSIVKIIGIAVGVLLIVILAGGFFARGMIMSMMPFTKGLYEMIGLGEKVGAGLNLGTPKMVFTTARGKPALVVRGVITNISDETQAVPMIKIILRDSERHDIHSSLAAPARNQLKAKERMSYKVTVIEPSPLARGIAVVFAAPEEAMADKKKVH